MKQRSCEELRVVPMRREVILQSTVARRHQFFIIRAVGASGKRVLRQKKASGSMISKVSNYLLKLDSPLNEIVGCSKVGAAGSIESRKR